MDFGQLFWVVEAGPARWEVRHKVTDELAGAIQRTPRGFLVRDEQTQLIGSVDSIRRALERLYDVA